MNDPASKKPKIALGAYVFLAFIAAAAIVVFAVVYMQRSKTDVAPVSASR